MASYADLYGLRENSDLLNRASVAVAIVATAIALEADSTPKHAERARWSRAALASPEAMARRMIWSMLALSESATVGQILTVTDANMRARVEQVVNHFADEFASVAATP